MQRACSCFVLFVFCAPIAAAAAPGVDAAEPARSRPDADKAAEPPEAGTADAPTAAEPPAPMRPPAPVPAAAPAAPVEPVAFDWQPFGYLRMQYIVVQDDPNVAFVGRDDGFELQNARIGATAKLRDAVVATVALDGAVDERAQNTPQGKLRVGLRDAFADVALGGELVVRAGYFQTWVDPQALVPDTSREFVDKPLESRGVRSTEGWYTPGLPPGRSLGAALRLSPSRENRLGFELAVQNGADEFSSNNDNDKPAISVAALLRLSGDGFLVAAGRWNPRTVGELPFRQDETDLQGSAGAQIAAGPLSVGAGGFVQRTTFESTGGPVQNAYGAHAQLIVRIAGPRPVAFGYRFAILDPSTLIVTDRVMEHTAGAVMAVPSLHLRVQLQLTHVQEQAERELSNGRIQLATEVTL